MLISFNAYSEWFYVRDDNFGNSNYIENETIRENNGYVYYWSLADYLDPSTTKGMYSSKDYIQGDCAIGRVKQLNFIAYKEHMGKGSQMASVSTPGEWKYPAPDTMRGYFFNIVCEYIKLE